MFTSPKTVHNKSGKTPTKQHEDKGNWEASFFQRGRAKDQLNEQCVKAECPLGSFDPFKIPQLMNPTISREQELLAKRDNGGKLNSVERLIVSNYIEKQQQLYQNDIRKIDAQGLNAKPETIDGRLHLLFRAIKYQIEKGMNEMVYYTFNKINEFTIPDYIKSEYAIVLAQIENIISTLDTVELQFNKFHSNMPPLNERGFIKLDPFQEEVVRNIDNNISSIVQAPTSAGKSILTGYLYTKPHLKVLVVVPTDPLAWQMSAMIGKITHTDVPLITRTFQSEIGRNDMVQRIEQCGIVVGTPQYLVDYLPLIKIQFDWVVVDEIHMIGKKTCGEMEVIIKTFCDVPILALSATIGNVDMLRQWFINMGHTHDIGIIRCDKRFFNLQRFYYDNSMEEELVRIHPFSTVTYDDFSTGNILKRSLNPTPPDIWDLAIIMNNTLPVHLKIRTYFAQTQCDKLIRITLDQANQYFIELLTWMVANHSTKQKMITKIIDYYHNDDMKQSDFDLYDVAMTLKKNEKTPALIFQTDSHECLELVRKFSRKIRDEEEKAYPNLLKERLRQQSRVKVAEKKMEQMKVDKMGDKQISKMLMAGTIDQLNDVAIDIAIYEPHSDFIMSQHQQFTHHMINMWDKELKQYFPHNGCEYHYIIDLLWRGVGVYCKGLPDAYLHIIQNLACGGKLGVVFSDDSLVFGVSMPFRTTVITPDDIDSMMYHQMAGRAGRRGLDKEGNVVMVGYSWSDIVKLSTSCIPDVTGCDTMFYGACYGTKLHNTIQTIASCRWDKMKSHFLLDKITPTDAIDFYESIDMNIANGWEFATSYDNITFNHMMWRFRHSEDCFRVAFLLNFIRKIFKNCNPRNENTQVEFAKFMAHYIDMVEATDTHILSAVESAQAFPIKEHLTILGLDSIAMIDSKVFESIRMNRIIDTPSRKDKSILRERLLNFGEKIRNIQHYFFHSKEIAITRLLGKLLTRIWWIYHTSSPVMDCIERCDLVN